MPTWLCAATRTSQTPGTGFRFQVQGTTQNTSAPTPLSFMPPPPPSTTKTPDGHTIVTAQPGGGDTPADRAFALAAENGQSAAGVVVVSDDETQDVLSALTALLPPAGGWMPLADAYVQLRPEQRAVVRRGWKSVVRFCEHFPRTFLLNETRTHATRADGRAAASFRDSVKGMPPSSAAAAAATPSAFASPVATPTTPESSAVASAGGVPAAPQPPAKPGPAFTSQYPVPQVNVAMGADDGVVDGSTSKSRKRKRAKQKKAALERAQIGAELAAAHPGEAIPDVSRAAMAVTPLAGGEADEIREAQPPDPSQANNPTQKKKEPSLNAAAIMRAGAISLQMLVGYVPPHFVPVSSVLANMPGYEAAHLERFAQDTKSFEYVVIPTLGGGEVEANAGALQRTPTGKQRAPGASSEMRPDGVSAPDPDQANANAADGSTFVRLHGGLGTRMLCDVSSADGIAARRDPLLARFKIPMDAAPDFARAIGLRAQWKGLRNVYEGAGPDAGRRIPFPPGPQCLLFFAQLQHIFLFDASNGGGVSLPPIPTTRLTWHTSPAPTVIHEILRLIPANVELNGVVARVIVENLSPESKALLWACAASEARVALLVPYVPQAVQQCGPPPTAGSQGRPPQRIGGPPTGGDPTRPPPPPPSSPNVRRSPYAPAAADLGGWAPPAEADLSVLPQPWTLTAPPRADPDAPMNMVAALLRFVHWHGGVLGVKSNTDDMVMPAHLVEVDKRQQLPAREQLKMLLQRGRHGGQKNQIKRLRRRIIAEETPDNPLLVEKNLAKFIHDSLPANRAVTMLWIRSNIPEDAWHLIPAASRKFLVTHPDCFALWNTVHREGRLFIARPSALPPKGAIKTDPNAFSDDDIIWTVARFLMSRTHPPERTCSAMIISNRIPVAVDMAIRVKYVGMTQFAQKFPEYFGVTIRNAVNESKLRASDVTITLLKTPHRTTLPTFGGGDGQHGARRLSKDEPVGEDALDGDPADGQEDDFADDE